MGGRQFALTLAQLYAAIGSLAGEGFHTPGAYFSHAGKVGKRALRGFAPKDPRFGNRVVERFALETMSVVGLPTNLGTLQQSACRPVKTGRLRQESRCFLASLAVYGAVRNWKASPLARRTRRGIGGDAAWMPV